MNLFNLKPTKDRIDKWESKRMYNPLLKALDYPDNIIKREAVGCLGELVRKSLLSEQANIEVRNRILELAKTLDTTDELLISYCADALRHFDGADIRDYYHSIFKNENLAELYGKNSMILQWAMYGLCNNSGDGTTLELIMHLIEEEKLGIIVAGNFTDYGHNLLKRAVRSDGYDSEFLNIICSKALKNVRGNRERGCSEAAIVLNEAFDKNKNHSAKQEVKAWLYSKHAAVRKYADQF